MSIVFKWGSLVGISLPSSGANQTLPFVASDVAFRPKEFAGIITNDWTTVPWCATDFGNYGNTATDHLSSINDPVAGIGDICRYMGVIDGSTWRIPTQSELNELYGSDQQDKGQSVKLGSGWTNGSYHPLSGRAFGAGRNYVIIYDNNTEARVVNADAWINGSVFFSTSGRREVGTGAIAWIGSDGYCWSSTAASTGNGYRMWFNSGTVAPQNPAPRIQANAVRCIRE